MCLFTSSVFLSAVESGVFSTAVYKGVFSPAVDAGVFSLVVDADMSSLAMLKDGVLPQQNKYSWNTKEMRMIYLLVLVIRSI